MQYLLLMILIVHWLIALSPNWIDLAIYKNVNKNCIDEFKVHDDI